VFRISLICVQPMSFDSRDYTAPQFEIVDHSAGQDLRVARLAREEFLLRGPDSAESGAELAPRLRGKFSLQRRHQPLGGSAAQKIEVHDRSGE
jgi:hypothetical protein